MAHPREGWQGHGAPRKLTRRSFLGTAGGALAALGAAPLLEACSSALAGSGTVPLARPDHPVTWPLFPGNQAIASNLARRAGRHPADLYLGGVHQPGRGQLLRQEVQVQDADHHVQHDERGHEQAAQRALVRRAGRPHRGPDGPDRQHQAGPAAQPLLHPEHLPGLARLHQPVLRPGLAVHGAVHHLHDRDRLA